MQFFLKGIYLVPFCFLLVNCGGGSETPPVPEPPGQPQNSVPIAKVDSILEVDIETPLELDGNNSSDSDGDSLTYEWKVIDAPTNATVFIEDENSATTRLVVDSYGSYDVALTVFDGQNYSEPDIVTINAKKLPIDCNNLNPGKVYLHGMLDLDNRYTAIADPTDPTDFCIGFSDRYTYEGRIADTGRFIYAGTSEERFYAFQHDTLAKDENNFWIYPQNTSENDELLHVPDTEGCGLLHFYLIPGTEEALYSCPNAWYHTFTQSKYFYNDNGQDNEVITVLPDRSVLAYNQTEGLIHMDSQQNITQIPYDLGSGSHLFVGARQYVDNETGKPMLWVNHFSYLGDDREFKRLQINLETFDINQDVPYENVTNFYSAYNSFEEPQLSQWSGKYDLQGYLWIKAWRRGTESYLILKIPPTATGVPVRVIYDSNDYQDTEVYIGPTESCSDFPWLDVCDDGVYRWERYENNVVKIDNNSRLITSY